MSIYNELKNNPPKFDINKSCEHFVFDLVSVMCDNKKKFELKKTDKGFKFVSIQHFNNFRIKNYDKTDIEWLADEGKFQEIVDIMNSGTVKVQRIRQKKTEDKKAVFDKSEIAFLYSALYKYEDLIDNEDETQTLKSIKQKLFS